MQVSSTMAAQSSSSTAPASPVEKGVAGRINYAAWDKVATDLVQQVDQEDQVEIADQKAKLGLDGKYARSHAEAEERVKAKNVKQAKKKLDQFQKREKAVMQTLAGLLGPVTGGTTTTTTEEETRPTTQSAHPTAAAVVVRITRDMVDAGRRVVAIADTRGRSPALSHIVVTQDLSHLESIMPSNHNQQKSFADDAENDVPDEPSSRPRSIYGLIKLFLTNLHDCTVLIKCKIITGTVELHNCSNVVVQIEKEATVATVQADLSQNITIEFHDAPSGKNVVGQYPMKYWGEDPNDRIFHAGLTNLRVAVYRDGFLETETVADYQKDGAEAIGNATPEEFQFVTSCDGDDGLQLRTEAVVRAGKATGENARAMTDRELQSERERRERAGNMALKMAEDMVQIKDKDGNVLMRKTTEEAPPAVVPTNENEKDDEEEIVEELYTSCSPDEIKSIVAECEKLKARGNEAFGAGEYGQAILQYSLCLDKAAELPDADDNHHDKKASLFPRDVIYSNRAACFLKLGQHEKAQADAEAALHINVDNVKAHFRKGLALHAAQRYAEALPVLAHAHRREPHNQQIKQALQFAEVRLQQEQRKRMEQL